MQLLAFAGSIQLFPDGTLFIHIALILVMMYILNRTFYKPIDKVMAEREKFSGGHSTEADEMIAKAVEKESAVAAALLEARSEGYSLIEKQQREAEAARQAKLAALRSETAARLEKEKAEISKQTAEAREAIAAEAEKLADKIAGEMLKA
jgi:F-type H+-transporting ATPase subunit b